MGRTGSLVRPGAVAVGVLLLIDVLRVWLPSVITIFGRAGSTSAATLGAFALAWFIAPLLLLPARRWLGPTLFTVGAAVALAGVRLALLAVRGGSGQLYLASVGVLVGICWLAGTAAEHTPMVPGLPGGIALAAIQHSTLGLVDLTWQHRWWAWALAAIEATAFVAGTLDGVAGRDRSPSDDVPGAGRSPGDARDRWFVAGPALLLAGMFAAAPAVASTAASYLPGALDLPGADLPGASASTIATSVPGWWAPTLVIWSVISLFGCAVRPPRRLAGRIVAVASLIAASVIFGYAPPAALGLAVVIGAPALGACLGLAARDDTVNPGRPALATAAGMLVFGIAVFAYYAAYDAGYPNNWVPAVIALVIGVLALRASRVARRHERRFTAAIAVCVVALAVLVPTGWSTPPSERPRDDLSALRIVTYNIQMGLGLHGVYDPAAAAEAIGAQRPQLVTLSEVDRGWLLNGGHDTLNALARRLGLRYYFAPAADSLWGDAVLTNLPVTATRTIRLTADGAPTGAQALGVIVRVGGREITVVATHIQPPSDRPPLVQVGEIAAFATDFGGDRPTLIAGDLNIEPGSESMRAFAAAGYADGFAAQRPVRTYPSDQPVEQIDHILVRGGLRADAVVVSPTTASDHSLVAATVSWP